VHKQFDEEASADVQSFDIGAFSAVLRRRRLANA
jgi:hypothetical protein